MGTHDAASSLWFLEWRAVEGADLTEKKSGKSPTFRAEVSRRIRGILVECPLNKCTYVKAYLSKRARRIGKVRSSIRFRGLRQVWNDGGL